MGVNTGEGAFSSLIRNYTFRQLHLHQGSGITMESVEKLMQDASDEIARYVIEDGILNQKVYNGTLPNMEEIAKRDVAKALEIVFAEIDQYDSAKADGAAWSGAILFPLFSQPGVTADESGRLIAGNSISKLDSLADLRNILFAIDAFNFGYEQTSINDITWNDMFVGADLFTPDTGSASGVDYFNAFINVADIGTSAAINGLLVSMLAGTSAGKTVEDVTKLDPNLLLDQLGAIWGNDFNTSDSSQFLTNAHALFSTMSIDTLDFGLTFLSDFSPEDLLVQANNSMAFRYALVNLIPFAIGDNAIYEQHNENGELALYDPVTGEGTWKCNILSC